MTEETPAKSFDFDTPATEFPTVWNANEYSGTGSAIEELEEIVDTLRNLDIDAVINKHICLAVREYVNTGHAWAYPIYAGEGLTGSFRPGIRLSFLEDPEDEETLGIDRVINIEDEFMRMEGDEIQAAGFLQMAESFERLAAHMRKCAEARQGMNIDEDDEPS